MRAAAARRWIAHCCPARTAATVATRRAPRAAAMKTLGVILLSVGLNVALLYLNVRVFLSPPPPELAAPMVTRVVTNTVWRVARGGGSAPSVITNPPPRIPFHWSQIEAPEYPTYIANLRKFDCPERTIQNIIIADVSKTYEARAADLESTDGERFWVSGSTLLNRQRERLARQRVIEEERLRLLQQLLGIDPFADPRATGRGRELVDGDSMERLLFYSHLAPAKRDAAERLVQRSQAQGEFLQGAARRAGFGHDEETARRQREARDTELAKLLTPEELTELRNRVAALELKYAGLELTAAELRGLAQIHARASGRISVFDQLERAPAAETFERDVQALLGAQRWPDYLRAQESGFEKLLEFTGENGLPKLSAKRAFDVRAAAERAAAAINGNEELAPEDATRLLRDLQTATAGKLKLELGTTLAEKYFEQDSAWLKDLARPRPQKTPPRETP